MRANRIIVAALVLIGFGSCAHRASKSKKAENPQADSMQMRIKYDSDTLPVLVMYGVPARPYRQNEDIREKDAPRQTTEPTAGPTE